MDHYCEQCGRYITIKIYVFDNPDFFGIDESYKDYLTNQN